MLNKLRTVDLVQLGLAKLSPGGTWKYQFKRQNLINAFAEIYDDVFTEGARFEIFDNIGETHLREVMFNATDFHHGFIFRFQNEGVFGNARFRVVDDIARQVRLSDIIAASSCFTGGFEPIDWPHDFLDLAELSPTISRLRDLAPTALMDGGIYDNQGIDSVLLSEKRKHREPYDLIIVSDVTSPNMKPFQFSEVDHDLTVWNTTDFVGLQKKVTKYYRNIRNVLLFIFIAGPVIPLIFDLGPTMLTGVLLTLGLIAGFVLLAGIFLMKTLRAGKARVTDKIAQAVGDQIPVNRLAALDFTQIPFSKLASLLTDRTMSLVSLVGDVWLKVVRRLVYRQLYEDDAYDYRRISNLIRELTRSDFEKRVRRSHLGDKIPYFRLEGCDPMLVGSYSQVISKKIELIVEDAAAFGTNLWFTEKDKIDGILKKLIVCGQVSICFNLLIYLTELRLTPGNGYQALDSEIKGSLDSTYLQCLRDWKRFQTDPEFLYRTLEREELV